MSIKHLRQLFPKRKIAAGLLGVLLWILLPLPGTNAAVSFSNQDMTTPTPVAGSDIGISGSYMIYGDDDADGRTQLFVRDLITNTVTAITYSKQAKRNPSIGGSLVVWEQFAGGMFWDIYGYDISTGDTRKLNGISGAYSSPRTDGQHVVWYNPLNLGMFLYDSVSQQAQAIGKGRNPVVAKGKVVFVNSHNEGLSLFTIATGQTEKVVDLQSDNSTGWLNFNGSFAVWRHNVGYQHKYVMIDINNLADGPRDLMPLKPNTVEYMGIQISDTYAAWIEDQNGLPAIKGAYLPKAETFQIATGSSDNMLYSLVGGSAVIRGPGDTLLYRTIVRTETTDNPSSGSLNAVPDNSAKVQRMVGADGGELETEDKEIKLVINKGTYTKETLVTVEPGDDVVKSGSFQPQMKQVSSIWKLSFEQGNQPHTLSIRFDASKLLPQKIMKLGIYRWDETTGAWVYEGGKVQVDSKQVSMDVHKPGVYALILYDVSFQDIQGHWAQNAIEILASRWVVNGMTDELFAPESTLTRAQFAKMLGGALGLKEMKPNSSSFLDVGSSHWSYGWVEAAYQAGLVQGDGRNFNPDASITREQMMVMLVRALNLEKEAQQILDTDMILPFSDRGDISEWAKPYVAIAARQKLVEGDSLGIHPVDSSNRAQAATVMMRLLMQTNKL